MKKSLLCLARGVDAYPRCLTRKKQSALRDPQSVLGCISCVPQQSRERVESVSYASKVILAALAPRQSVARASAKTEGGYFCRKARTQISAPGSMALASPEDALFSFQLVFPSSLFSCRRFFHVRVSSFSTMSHFPPSPPCMCIHQPLSFPHHSIFVSNCENCLSLLRKMFRCSHH